ncbi:cyclin-dependent kinase 12-like isoform X2 [Varroa destructor]|uniref:Protein kinase domain-containing protein n=1 Tax=Varroa destructor TaxID=109461 RepID=A0A7M7KBE8_VARDE|nr:cyclin-dependent kinase 12-like isoform X2 [Varroa destructor]
MSEFECTPVEVCREKHNGEEWHNVTVRKAKDGNKVKLIYKEVGDVGKGTFGTVRKIVTQDGQTYALKRLEHDPRFKNREVAIMRELDHTNCCRLFYYYSEKTEAGKPEMSINLVMEYVSDTLSAIVSRSRKQSEDINHFLIQLYLYQLLRGTAYMHSKKIAHRDIKPQNILIENKTALLKICDFGSAKRLTEGEPNVAYICSRFYRAPELILGNTHYDVSVDTWAIGCVFAEMFLLKPIFVGDSSIDQLTEIIRVLGTPTPEQMDKLHPKFPKTLKKRDPVPLIKALKNKPSTKAIRLLTKMLQYMPDTRIRCWEALAEPFFDDLRRSSARLPDNKPLPPLFDFTSRELEQNPVLNQLLIPSETTESSQQEPFHVYTASDCLKFGPVWIPQVPIPSQFIPGLASGESPAEDSPGKHAAKISPKREVTEVTSLKVGAVGIHSRQITTGIDSGRAAIELSSVRDSSELNLIPSFPRDISDLSTSRTHFDQRWLADASDPTTAKTCPGLPPSIDASEQNTTRTLLERLGFDSSDPTTARTFRGTAFGVDASEQSTSLTRIDLPIGSSLEAPIQRMPPSMSTSEENTSLTVIDDPSTKALTKEHASQPSVESSPAQFDEKHPSSDPSTDGVSHVCTEHCYANSTIGAANPDSPEAENRPHELVRLQQETPQLKRAHVKGVPVTGLDYEYICEEERKFVMELPNIAEKVGMSREGVLALGKLIWKHKPILPEPAEGVIFDADMIDRERARTNAKIKKDASEVMSADDVAKLDKIFALAQRERNSCQPGSGEKHAS